VHHKQNQDSVSQDQDQDQDQDQERMPQDQGSIPQDHEQDIVPHKQDQDSVSQHQDQYQYRDQDGMPQHQGSMPQDQEQDTMPHKQDHATNTSRRYLRSAIHGDLLVPRTRTVTYGPRSVAVYGPNIWNTLPSTLRVSATTLEQFQSGLKTILFRLAYWT